MKFDKIKQKTQHNQRMRLLIQQRENLNNKKYLEAHLPQFRKNILRKALILLLNLKKKRIKQIQLLGTETLLAVFQNLTQMEELT